jgi:hypothetical protein
MGNWVKCTDSTEEANPISCFINLDHVARIVRYGDDAGTLLTMSEGGSFTVKERPEELLRSHKRLVLIPKKKPAQRRRERSLPA